MDNSDENKVALITGITGQVQYQYIHLIHLLTCIITTYLSSIRYVNIKQTDVN